MNLPGWHDLVEVAVAQPVEAIRCSQGSWSRNRYKTDDKQIPAGLAKVVECGGQQVESLGKANTIANLGKKHVCVTCS